MESEAIQRIAQQKSVRRLRVKERLDPEMVAGTEEVLAVPIPDREGEVADQVLNASSPQAWYACRISSGSVAPSRIVRPLAVSDRIEISPAIHPRIGGDPDPAVQTAGLLLVLGFPGGAQHRVAEAHVAVDPDGLGIRAAEGHEVRHLFE